MIRIKQTLIALSITLLLIAGLEGVLALCGVKPIVYDKDPYVGFSGKLPLYIEERDDAGIPTGYLVTAPDKEVFFNRQRFPKEKADGTCRIFCLGGSTAYGRPYMDKPSFSGWLRAMLPKADPSQDWEVINAGGISYASYRVCLVMEELARYQPDLFIVYSGHNEFLERRTYPNLIATPPAALQIGAALRDLRAFAVARKTTQAIEATFAPAPKPSATLPAEVTAMLDWAAGPWAYERDEGWRTQVLGHYRYNLARMANIARAAGAEILYINTPVNLRDCLPFKSTHRDDLDQASLTQWENHMLKASDALSAGDWPSALKSIDAAAAFDDRYARLHYERGRALWALGRHAEAKAAFERAVDEDVCPLRALTCMPGIVAQEAKEQDALFVDFAAWITAQAEDGTPGSDLFRDHVHPNIEGHRQIALMVMDQMRDANILHPADDWGPERIETAHQALLATLTQEDHSESRRNLFRVLKWGGKFQEAEENFREGMKLNPSLTEFYFLRAEGYAQEGNYGQAENDYRAAIKHNPDFVRAYVGLGDLLALQGQDDSALIYYRLAVEIEPQYLPAYDHLGQELIFLGQEQEAAKTYEQVLRLNMEWAEAHHQLGRALAGLNRLREAEAEYRQALLLECAPETHESYGLLLSAMRRWEEAAEQYRQVCRLVPYDAAAQRRRKIAETRSSEEAERKKVSNAPRREHSPPKKIPENFPFLV